MKQLSLTKAFLSEQEKLLIESTDASTKFEGVIVDCWNYKGSNEKLFKNTILRQSNTKSFLNLKAKGWPTTGISSEEQAQVLWDFSRLLKQKVKAGSGASSAGQSKPSISEKWTQVTGKKVDTSKTDVIIGGFGVSVKGPKALLMSGEQKESAVTVLSAVEEAKATNQIKEDLLLMVDQFITVTRTYGGVTDELPKGMTVTSLIKRGDEGKIVDERNMAAFAKIKDQKELKSKVEQTFKEAFNIPAVGQAFAWEAMTGWEKFGGKTFGTKGDDSGRATHMLVWDYDLKKIKFDDMSKIKGTVAKKMNMKADMKSGSWAISGKKGGYSFFQTVRLNVDTVFDKTDELQNEAYERIDRGQKLLSEGVIDEGMFKGLVSRTWGWFKEKMKQLWNWAVQKFIELKTAINELFDKGLNLVMDFYEIVPSVRVNTEIRLI